MLNNVTSPTFDADQSSSGEPQPIASPAPELGTEYNNLPMLPVAPDMAFYPPYPPYPPRHHERPGRRNPRVWIALALLVVLALGVGIGLATSLLRSYTSGNVVIGASSPPAVSTSSSTQSVQQSLEQVASAVSPSIVKITSVSSQQEAIGSGDILTSNGYIVTNDHVVAGYSSFSVLLTSGAHYTATVVGQDAQDDLAVLKIAATNLKPVSFANSSQAKVGELAVAIGYPLGLQETSTYGIVSALDQTVSEAPSGPAGELPDLIQTSAQLNPGNSGGALLDIQGQLIGIPTLSATNSETGTAADGIGYAIPSNRVEYVASQLIQYGKLVSSKQGFLGIQGADVTPQIVAAYGLSVDSGVYVSGFANDAAGSSPAQQAGLQTGDIITAVNGQSVSSSDDLASATLTQAPGTRVTLTVIRGSSEHSISVTLGERPSN
jgi:S1-C subfamily serine protease